MITVGWGGMEIWDWGRGARIGKKRCEKKGWGLLSTLPSHPKGVPSPGGPGPSLVSSRRRRILPGKHSALVRRGRDELFSAAQHQAVSPAGWAGGAARREGAGRRGWQRAPCSPRTFSWPSSCRTAAQVREGRGLGTMWGGAGREGRGGGSMSWALGLES